MRARNIIVIFIVAALIAVPLTVYYFFLAADDEPEGRLALYVRDQPTDRFESIHVTFSDAKVFLEPVDVTPGQPTPPPSNGTDPAEGGNASEGDPGDGDDTPGGPAQIDPFPDERDAREDALGVPSEALMTAPREVDLLRFRGPDSRAFLGAAWIPTGDYDTIEATLSDARGVLADGSEVELHLPSDRLRAVEPFRIEPGETTRVVLDVDLDAPGVLVAVPDPEDEEPVWSLNPLVTAVDVVEGASGAERDTVAGETVRAPTAGNVQETGRVDVHVTGFGSTGQDTLWITVDRVEVLREDAADGSAGEGALATDPFGRDPNVPAGEEPPGGPGTGFGGDPLIAQPDDAEDAPPGAAWVRLAAEPKSIDLESAQGSAGAPVGGDILATGTFSGLRLHVSEAWTENAQGERETVQLAEPFLLVPTAFVLERDDAVRIVVVVELSDALEGGGGGAAGGAVFAPQIDLRVERERLA